MAQCWGTAEAARTKGMVFRKPLHNRGTNSPGTDTDLNGARGWGGCGWSGWGEAGQEGQDLLWPGLVEWDLLGDWDVEGWGQCQADAWV